MENAKYVLCHVALRHVVSHCDLVQKYSLSILSMILQNFIRWDHVVPYKNLFGKFKDKITHIVIDLSQINLNDA